MRRIPILCYHRVCPRSEAGTDSPSLCVTPAQFGRQMLFLKRLGWRTVSLQDILSERHGRKHLPSRAVALTFDDGYQDNFRYAFPALRRRGFTATIFLVTDRIGKSNDWDSGSLPLLGEEEIREMAEGGISFGSHTASHIDLAAAPEAAVREELTRSREKVEELTLRTDVPFCYPYSRLNERSKTLVRKAGYALAVAGDRAGEGRREDDFELTRVQVFPSTSLFGFWKKIQPWYPEWLLFQERLKAKRPSLQKSQ